MMMTVKRLAILALGASAAILVAAGGGALADDRDGWRKDRGQHGGWHHRGRGHEKMSRAFERRYDANRDGEVTQDEIDTNRLARHGKYDENGDGKLSLEEFQGLWMEAYRLRMVREFQEFDVDGDAVVTLEEYTEPMADFIERREDRERHRGRRGRHRGEASPSDDATPAE